MINFAQVSKRYGRIAALTDLSFHIKEGITGLLGPNGAGKSTALRLIAGYFGPTSGTVRVLGGDPTDRDIRRSIGYLPEGAPLSPDATVLEILDFAASTRGINRPARTRVIRSLCERLNLSPLAHRFADTLSKGQRRRVALAIALVGDPTILILDEPTDGLDPNQRDEVHQLINELAPGRMILISTHMLDEAERVCDRALIMSEGQLLADGAPHQIAAGSRHHNAVSIELERADDLPEVARQISALPSVSEIEVEAEHRQLTALAQAGSMPFADIAALAASAKWRMIGIHRESGRLEDVFRKLTHREARE